MENYDSEHATLAQHKAYVEELKEHFPKYEEVFTFDTDNLTVDERELLLLEAEVFHDKQCERNRIYYAKNKEYYRAKAEAFRKANPEKHAAYRKKYIEDHPEYYKIKVECELCKGMYLRPRLKNHIGTRKHINAIKDLKVKENAHRLE